MRNSHSQLTICLRAKHPFPSAMPISHHISGYSFLNKKNLISLCLPLMFVCIISSLLVPQLLLNHFFMNFCIKSAREYLGTSSSLNNPASLETCIASRCIIISIITAIGSITFYFRFFHFRSTICHIIA